MPLPTCTDFTQVLGSFFCPVTQGKSVLKSIVKHAKRGGILC